MDLKAPVQYVKGIGPQRAEALSKVGVCTAEDLLLHLPMRYEDRRSFARVADLRPGMRVSVSGEIAVAGLRRARRRPDAATVPETATRIPGRRSASRANWLRSS